MTVPSKTSQSCVRNISSIFTTGSSVAWFKGGALSAEILEFDKMAASYPNLQAADMLCSGNVYNV